MNPVVALSLCVLANLSCCVQSLSPVILITTSCNLLTMYNIIMYFLSLIMVLYVIPICHHELLPFVDEKWQFLCCMVSKSSNFDQNCIKLINNIKFQNVFPKV